MEVHIFFLQLAAILITARIFAEVATRLGAPSVIGELLAGVFLGPSLLGWFEPNEIIELLAQIGIILLLFEVGLETDIGRLVRTGVKSLVVAIGGFVLPLLLGYVVCHSIFGLPLLTSLFVGGTLTATSIGITVRILSDLHRQHSREAQIVLGAAVMDDVLGVIMLALLYEFSISGGISVANAGKVTLFVGVFFVVAPVAAKTISLIVRRFDAVSQTPGLIPTTIVSLVLLFAWLAHAVGAPELLGGFAAGLALSRRFFLPFGLAMQADIDFTRRIDDQMKPIVQLFTPIFFVMVGLALDLRSVDWSSSFIWAFSLVVVGIAIVGKFGGALLLAEPWAARIAIGMAMVPRGEVGLIFAELGRVAGVFDDEVYAAVILVIAYTTLLSPFWIKLFYRLHGHRLEPPGSRPAV